MNNIPIEHLKPFLSWLKFYGHDIETKAEEDIKAAWMEYCELQGIKVES